ncbi:hypothetical protein I350_05400 [Cryptococcus amylolentus CBS 6273]|uniref:Holocytochrome c-type synthase n=1 Tax=Cryptococcus amylolentus CBS 6273 TaxID=1296118 RepID=A0A1E3JVD9_9TREE|nr:hypothetical protein I350_05400 [Cryptococcus amylolentus CBS 6273]
MKWNIGSPAPVPVDHTAPVPPHPVPASSSNIPASCPMHQSTPPPPPSAPAPAACPIKHDALDPNTHMPANLSLSRQPNQQLDLPVERTASTIPRPASGSPGGEAYGTGNTWDYPSPQQFYNALVRKGWETPEDSVEVMVAIHNFLNERAWEEVMKWEKRLPGGENTQLVKFQGRPGELSPKARFHLWAGQLFPSKFNSEPPFDRHDWVVKRTVPSASNSNPSAPPETYDARYVIDYYSAPPDEDGNPVFSLDVRPALDSFEAVKQRVVVGVEEWWRGQEVD